MSAARPTACLSHASQQHRRRSKAKGVSFGFLWFPLVSFGFLWFPLVFFGFPLVFIGFLWFPLVFFGLRFEV
jgi:fatty acid desaturase